MKDWPDLPGKEGIVFSSADKPLPACLSNTAHCQKLFEKWIQVEGGQLHNLQYIFCSDEYLLQINREYLSHDTYTDIITFPFQQAPIIDSDIYISLDRVHENAKTYQTSFRQELLRVMAHGVLHLLGYGDKTTEEQQRMREKEESAINFLLPRL